MTSIADIIRDNRPKLSPSSVATYASIIRNLMKKLDTEDNSVFHSKPETVISHLSSVEPKNRKTSLAAIIVFIEKSGSKATMKKYRDLMIDDVNTARKAEDKQEKTETQKDNWIPYDDIMVLYNSMEEDIKPFLKKKPTSPALMQRIQDFVILSCMILIPPRRLMDWTEMKLRNINEDEDNYMKKGKFYFNKYKTSKFYGTQTVEIPKRLKAILSKWQEFNDNEYLFVDTNNNKLTSTKLNQRLNRIFDKKISVNMLRHIYISDKVLKDVPKLEELQEVAKDMGHNVSEQMLYKKF
jgi:integrase